MRRLRSALGSVVSWVFFPFGGAAFERWAMPRSRAFLITFVAFFLFFFAAFAFMATLIARDIVVWSRLSNSGVAAVATINEASVHVLKRSPRYSTSIDYAFKSNDGIERKGAMRRDLRIHPSHLTRGGGLRIVYDPAWPALNAPRLELEDIAIRNNVLGVTLFGLGAVWFVLSAFQCAMHLRRRRGKGTSLQCISPSLARPGNSLRCNEFGSYWGSS